MAAGKQKQWTPIPIAGLVLAVLAFPAGAQIKVETGGGSWGFSIPPDDGQIEIELGANSDWTVSIDADWLRPSLPGGGAGTWKLTLSYRCNPTPASRAARVQIGASTIAVTQTAGSVCPWKERAGPQYTIHYSEEFEQDVAFVDGVLQRALEIMRNKYKLETLPFPVKVFLHPRPNTAADQNTARTSSSRRSLPVWIDYLTPSAPQWKTAGWSSLLQEKDSPLYHRQTLIHEFAHVIQMGLSAEYWRLPAWVYEGLAHYEGVFNSSEENRQAAHELVGRWIKSNPGVVVCCQTLGGEGLSVTDIYNGGAFFWHAIAESYDEDVHRRMFADTKSDALKLLTEATGSSAEEIFRSVKAVFEKITKDLTTVSLPITSLTVNASAGSLRLSWTANGDWTAQTSASWLRFQLDRGGSGSFGGYALTWDANPYCASRTATLTIGGAVLTVTQLAAGSGCTPPPADP